MKHFLSCKSLEYVGPINNWKTCHSLWLEIKQEAQSLLFQKMSACIGPDSTTSSSLVSHGDLALSNRVTEILNELFRCVYNILWNVNKWHIRNVSWQTYDVVSRRDFSAENINKEIHEESINTEKSKCKEKFFIEPRLFLIFHAGVERITSEENRGGRKHRRNRYASTDTQSKRRKSVLGDLNLNERSRQKTKTFVFRWFSLRCTFSFTWG